MPKNQNQRNITTANQNEEEYHTEPMKLQSKNDKIALGAGKRVCPNRSIYAAD